MPEYIVRVSPDRVVLRTLSRNSASALYRNIVKAAKKGSKLATASITLEVDGAVMARHCPDLGLPAVMPMMVAPCA